MLLRPKAAADKKGCHLSRGTIADVAIVGGGIIGCLNAYELSKAGHSVTVVEADALASEASGTSGGWQTPYAYTVDPAMLALAPRTLQLHRELAQVLPEETGIDHGFEETPYLRCALTEERAEELRKWQSDRAREGVDTSWIQPQDMPQVSTWVTADTAAALLSNVEPTLDSYRLTLSAIQAAEKYGAEYTAGQVVGLLSSDVNGRSPRGGY